jgi:RimJ/RimL family protein N-acetyltransferase
MDLAHWTPRPLPPRAPLEGRTVCLEPLDPERHAADQWEAHRTGDPDGALWTYLPYGPFRTFEDYRDHLARQAESRDPMFFAVVEQSSGRSVGVLSLMRIDAANGVAEVGHICHSPAIRRTPGTTEAVRLLGGLLFDDLGYRRFEWKCDDANAPSKAAAERLGFRPEGLFRKHSVVKGRNRDTAWFAIVDDEWPAIRAAMDAWLDPENLKGGQRRSLTEMRAALARPAG